MITTKKTPGGGSKRPDHKLLSGAQTLGCNLEVFFNKKIYVPLHTGYLPQLKTNPLAYYSFLPTEMKQYRPSIEIMYVFTIHTKQ